MAHLDRSVTRPDSRLPVSGELLAVSVSLFFSAMGANAFVQFVVNYLVEAAGWPAARATIILMVAFGCMPLGRLLYPQVERRLGDANCLLAGNALFLLFLVLLAWVRDAWVILPAQIPWTPIRRGFFSCADIAFNGIRLGQDQRAPLVILGGA